MTASWSPIVLVIAGREEVLTVWSCQVSTAVSRVTGCAVAGQSGASWRAADPWTGRIPTAVDPVECVQDVWGGSQANSAEKSAKQPGRFDLQDGLSAGAKLAQRGASLGDVATRTATP